MGQCSRRFLRWVDPRQHSAQTALWRRAGRLECGYEDSINPKKAEMTQQRAPIKSRKAVRPKLAAAATAAVGHIKRAAPSLGHAGNTVKEAVAFGLKQLGTIESEIVRFTRRAV